VSSYVWDLFLKSLWRYQFTRNHTVLTPELNETLYHETQGITDLAVKIYMLTQIRAMTTGREQVTSSLIQSVAADSLRLAQPMLAALRSGDPMKLAQFEDIQPLDMETAIQSAQWEQAQTVCSPPVPTTRQKKQSAKRASATKPSQQGLLGVTVESGQTGYEALLDAGYMRPLNSYLEGDFS